MKGQWIGSYTGTVDGGIVVNIEEAESCYHAIAFITPNNSKIPSSIAHFKTEGKSFTEIGKAIIYPVDPKTRFQSEWDLVKRYYADDIEHSDNSIIKLTLEDKKLSISGLTNIGIEFSSELEIPNDTTVSRLKGEPKSWSEFKEIISGMESSKFLFRGQKEPWRLRTTFHRGERFRIHEFIEKDVKQLHQRLSAITKHYFDLTVPDQNGAFFNLLQHHGYPTPLLDWSYSPYVSAFFAFRSWPIGYSGEENIRVYIFNSEAWQKKYVQIQTLEPAHLHLSIMEFISIDNPRVVPQQAITTVTNIDDIEDYILTREKIDDVKYLRAIDIPAKERAVAMNELRFMGITAGSMFPSIDGVCEELKEKYFNV